MVEVVNMLQGSLENFALDEVLGLLSNTRKTGKLNITGDRGSGSLMFSEGLLVGADANRTPNGDTTEDIMFELLRFKQGNFAFTSEDIVPTGEEKDLHSVLSIAENRLQDWQEIENVVPSLDHIVTPTPELPTEEVTINRDEWAVLNVIAAGCPVSLVCDELNLGEVEGSRRIKNLAERSLVVVGDPLGYSSDDDISGISSNSPDVPPASNLVEEDIAVSMSHPVDYIDDVPLPPDMVEDFENPVPPSLAGLSDDEDTGKNSMLKRYLSSDD